MTTATSQRQPELARQIVVIGGAGLATHGRFFSDLPEQIGHVMVTAVGSAAR